MRQPYKWYLRLRQTNIALKDIKLHKSLLRVKFALTNSSYYMKFQTPQLITYTSI